MKVENKISRALDTIKEIKRRLVPSPEEWYGKDFVMGILDAVQLELISDE